MKDLDLLSAWDFELPDSLIASQPLEKRPDSRLLVVDGTGELHDQHFSAFGSFWKRGDVLVFNDTRVLPARLEARRQTGARVELLVVGAESEGQWDESGRMTAMLRSNRRVQIDEDIWLSDDAGTIALRLLERSDNGLAHLAFEGSLNELLHRFGRLPLPPYIEEQRKQRGEDVVQASDIQRYQSVLGEKDGAVAAPTASLHFDKATLQALKDAGVQIVRVTLHVGIGTFRPVKSERLSEHSMHSELAEMSEDAATTLNAVRANGGKIVAIGTTVVRVLESFVNAEKAFVAGRNATDIFIRPGYQFLGVDALLTNFHLPKSTLTALVAAFAGYENTMQAYAHAIAQQYRFFSYGDAMLLLPPDLPSTQGEQS